MNTPGTTTTRLRLRFTGRRRQTGIVRDQDILLSAVRPVTVVADGPAGPRTMDRELSFRSSGTTLRGTFTLPADGVAGRRPAVLLVVGSGPVDRDSNHRRLRLGITRALAECLALAGVASLRYDKRGVGASGGGDWREVGFWDGVQDARAALDALGAQPEIDPERIAVVGHSEGALIATALAGRGAPVRGVVLLAGSGVAGQDVLERQASTVLPTLPVAVRRLLRLLRIDPVAKTLANQERVRATSKPVSRIGGVRVNTGWMREFMDYDPAEDLAHIDVPLLAITGDKDLQANPDDLSIIHDKVARSVTIRMADLTHTMRRQSGRPSLRAYRSEVREPVDPELLAHVVDWIHGLE